MSMAPSDFRNFDITIDRDAHDRYRVRVVDSPAGQATAVVSFAGIEVASSDESTIGSNLFEALFQGQVRDVLRSSLTSVERDRVGLRIRLRIGSVPEIAIFPWEMLYDVGQGSFLSFSGNVSIVRYLDLPQPTEQRRATSPLHILAVLPDPKDLPHPDVEQSWQHLQQSFSQAIKQGIVRLDRLYPPTIDSLRKWLVDNTVHILHFSGHGAYFQRQRIGGLAFEDNDRKKRTVQADEIATLIRDNKTICFALLVACRGAQADVGSVFSGVAQHLVQAGLPVVVAMQNDVSTNAARTITKEFYTLLLKGYSVDSALTEARKAVFLNDSKVEWATPVLFSRSSDNQVVNLPVEKFESIWSEQTNRPTSPFLGPVPFQTKHSSLFFGRKRALAQLIDLLLAGNSPLIVLNGLSGVGKTSLLRAGLIPYLEQRNYVVAYCSILDSPESDVVSAVRNLLQQRDADISGDILSIVTTFAQQMNRPVILAVDQLERCFTLPQDNRQRLDFWRGIARLLNSSSHFQITVLLSVRADWLYAFQEVMPVPLNLPVFNFLLSLDPLSLDEAREALRGPLDYFGIKYENRLIDTIVEDLAVDGKHIYPPQLQIVGSALYSARHDSLQADVSILTIEDYRQLHGARSIIREHLQKIINHLGPNTQICWRILLQLAGSEGTRQSRPARDLQGNIAKDQFESIMGHLANHALVIREISTDDQTWIYTLTHDYLVQEINEIVRQDLSLQAWRTAEHYLDNGLKDWRYAKRLLRTEILLDRSRYSSIWEQREAFQSNTPEAIEFLARSGLASGESNVSYWLNMLPVEDASQLIVSYLFSDNSELSNAAMQAITDALRSKALKDELVLHLAQVFSTAYDDDQKPNQAEANGDETALSSGVSALEPNSGDDTTPIHSYSPRQVAALQLWEARSHLPTQRVLSVMPTLLGVWFERYGRQMLLATASVVMTIVIGFGIWLASERLKGTWTTLESLYAGWVMTADITVNSSAIYAITPQGRHATDGATLLKRAEIGAPWKIISNSFTHFEVIDSLVAQSERRLRFYVSIANRGIYRSDDEGTTWRDVNSGLHSYLIGSLVAEPENQDILYAGARDQRGVFQTTDGGNSWTDISGDQLLGSSVTAMAFTPFAGGLLLVGTDDGRIWGKQPEQTAWEAKATFPGTGVVVTLSAEPTVGDWIYAGTSNGTVLYSGDGGSIWSYYSKLPSIFQINSIAVTPYNPQRVFMSAYGIGGNNVWLSKDYGQSWESVSLNDQTRERTQLLINPRNPENVYAVGHPGIFESRDGGISWEHADIGAPIGSLTSYVVSPVENGPRYTSAGGAIFYRKSEGDPSWHRSDVIPTQYLAQVVADPLDVNDAFAVSYIPNKWSIFMTNDRGATWSATNPVTGIAEKYFDHTTAIAIAAQGNDRIIYAGSDGCGVIHSTDNGATWELFGHTACPKDEATPRDILSISIAPDSPEKIYVAADNNHVYMSRNRGQTWSVSTLPFVSEIKVIKADPVVPSHVYLVAGIDGFWRSDNDGQDWIDLSPPIQDDFIGELTAKPSTSGELYAASRDGDVWTTRNGGTTWNLVKPNEAIDRVTDLVYDIYCDCLVVATAQYGLHQFKPGSLWVSSK